MKALLAATAIVLLAAANAKGESVEKFLRQLCVENIQQLRNPGAYGRPSGEWVEVTGKGIRVGPNDGSVLIGMLLASGNSSATFYVDDLRASAGEVADGGGEDGAWRDPVTSRGTLKGSGRTTEKGLSGEASVSIVTEKNTIVDAAIIHGGGPCYPASCPTHADGSTHTYSAGALTSLSGLKKEGEEIDVSAWVFIPEGLYTVIVENPHNHRTDAPLYFCVDADDDGVIDLPEELTGTMLMEDVRRYARLKAPRVHEYMESLGEGEERNKAEILEAYLWNAGLENDRADEILVRHVARLEAAGERDGMYPELLIFHGLIRGTKGDIRGALSAFDRVRRLERSVEATSHIAIAVQADAAAVYEYTEAHAELYGDWAFVAPLSRVLFDYSGTKREAEGGAPIPEDEEKTKAALRIIWRADFGAVRNDASLPDKWKSKGMPEWQEAMVQWGAKALAALGAKPGEIEAFTDYKLGRSSRKVSLDELGL